MKVSGKSFLLLPVVAWALCAVFPAIAAEVPVGKSPGTQCAGKDSKADEEKSEKTDSTKSAEWYLKNWPSEQTSSEVIVGRNDGIYSWKNCEGLIVGKVEVKDGQPFNGITFVQGASDMRMVTRYDEGNSTLLAIFILKEGDWTVFMDKLSGEKNGADQPAISPEPNSENGEKPKSEAEKLPQ